MRIVLKHETYQVRSGWAARSPEVGMAAHGRNEDMARSNLAYTVRLFLAPFQREGTLEQEVQRMGLQVISDASKAVTVELS